MQMNRPVEALSGAVTVKRQRRLLTFTCQSERTIMLGTILLASAVSAAVGYLLNRTLSVDVLSSQLSGPEDCWLDWGMNIGRHCFSDYTMVVDAGMRPNPYEPYPLFLPWLNGEPLPMGGPAAAFVPHLSFGLPAEWLGAPRLGLIAYLLALAIAVLAPAVWAARGTHGLERVVVFVALGAAAIPVWAVIDRGNSVGFMVPIALVFLVALRRQRWALVAIMVVLAAFVKPQFVVFAVALFAARQWRMGGLALVGVVISNLAAYLLWPRDFPGTIAQSIHNLFYLTGSGFTQLLQDVRNVSFGRGVLLIPDLVKAAQAGGQLPPDFLAGPRSLIGYAVLVLIVVFVLALGRRIPPVMVGILLLVAAPLFPPLAEYYYLVFVLPVAALVVRDPGGPPGTGIFDQLATDGVRRRAVGICVSLAAALSIAQIPIPGPPIPKPIFGQLGATGVIGTTPIVLTTATLMPLMWLLACAMIMVSYAWRPARSGASAQEPPREPPPDTAINTSPTSSSTSERTTESSPQGSVWPAGPH
jgi:hypothetical protein